MIIIVMGISGAGKTTVGKRLAAALGWRFLEGDELHPPANIEKMRSGVPLSDADREPWLDQLRRHIKDFLTAGNSAVVACSALRHNYRERLRMDPQAVQFVYLKGEFPLLYERLRRRRRHYMHVAMLRSQLETLEEPHDAVIVDAALPVEAIVPRIRAALGV